MRHEEDEKRRMTAKKREEHWHMLRLSIEYLKQQETKWMTRRIAECERIKEEEKKDRLAIVSEQRKRYGLKGLNKEENMRLKKRTEERIEPAQARVNYWKWYRGEGRAEMAGNTGKEKMEAWTRLNAEIVSLEEEDEEWRQEEGPQRMMTNEGVTEGDE